MTITKAQLLDSIYRQVYLPKTKSAQVVDSLLEIIKSTLEKGEDVLIWEILCKKQKEADREKSSNW